MQERYGPGGQGPIPPIVINFNDCDNAASDQSDDKWFARISECSGRSCLVGSFESSTVGETSTVGLTSKAGAACDVYNKVLTEHTDGENSSENSLSSNDAIWQRKSCLEDELDDHGNIK